ncbi:uncharacterized protein LOC142631780 isoform X3 [Castanea sativa]|uniref:uncharacterized protein LOC142631780 isoform X3 n=1 Tax=Castanea sativa TaxID=21020 RepID=UPI003F64CD8B
MLMPIAITHTPHSSISTFPPPFPNSFFKFPTINSNTLSSCASTFFNKTLLIPNPNFIAFLPRRSPLRRASLRASATAATDYYSTLNVGRNATLQEIKASYRKLARKVLSDDEKRSLYDRFGEAGLQGENGGSSNYSQGVDPSVIFDAFFGGSDGLFGGMGEQGGINFNFRNRGNQALDIRYDLYMSFEEAIFGGQKEIEVPCSETCDKCDGTGAKSSSSIKSCMACGGRGGVMKSERTPFGVMSQVSTCLKCGGDGKIVTDYCQSCGGSGQVQSKRNMEIVIPPGVSDGATMQIQGEGNLDKKRGIAGDLYLVVHVNKKHGIWRDGLHLYSKINIDYTEAILGTVKKVETVEGMRDLQIPSGIQPGERVKMSRMGVPNINKPSFRGDHHFIVNVLIPKDISDGSDTERALVKELASLRASSRLHSDSANTNGTMHGDFDKHKIRDLKNHASSPGIKGVASLWKSIKNFLGQRRSEEGFASVSFDSSSSLRRCSKLDSSLAFSIFIFFIITCIFTLIGKTDDCTSVQKRNDNPSACRKQKERNYRIF